MPYLGFQDRELSLDEKAEILFAGQLYDCISLILLSYVIFYFLWLHDFFKFSLVSFPVLGMVYLICMYYLGSSVTAVVLGVIYGITNTFQPLPDDVFRYGEFLCISFLSYCHIYLTSKKKISPL